MDEPEDQSPLLMRTVIRRRLWMPFSGQIQTVSKPLLLRFQIEG